MMVKRLVMALAMSCVATSVYASVDMVGCQPVPRGGDFPFDYNDPVKREKFLKTVEGRHFTREVETLSRGNSTTDPFGDIAYTLKQIPNHPRALQALLRLAAREKATNIQGSSISVECFIKRAIEFVPNDLVPYMTLAQYYAQQGKLDLALESLREAEKIAPNNPNLAYNMGLLLADKKQYAQAQAYADIAYLGGFPLPGLRDKLKRAGVWREPTPLDPLTKPDSAKTLPAAEGASATMPAPASAPADASPTALP